MSNSNYSIDLERLKPVHIAYCGLSGLHNLAENWSWARDVNSRDRDETLVRLETVSRPRRRDRDHNPDIDALLGREYQAVCRLKILLHAYPNEITLKNFSYTHIGFVSY